MLQKKLTKTRNDPIPLIELKYFNLVTTNMKYFIFLLLLFSQLSLAKNDTFLDALIKDACNKKIVLLGEEGNHGGGQATLIKTEVVRRLAEECSFSNIYFESGFYDFLDFNHSIENKTATLAQLANSIGGLWSFTQEMDEIINYLFLKAQKGNIKIAGLDLQFGLTSEYAKNQLPHDLTSHLIKDKTLCQNKISQHINWLYDDANPYNESEKKLLKQCAIQIILRLEEQQPSNKLNELKQLASNFSSYLTMLDGNNFNVRDKQMFDNLLWLYKQLEKNDKIIIWTANIHALKEASQISSKIKPMGNLIYNYFRDQSFAVGITASAGKYYNRFNRSNAKINFKNSKSLEAQTLNTNHNVYLDTKTLQALSTTNSIILNYEKPKQVDWGKIFDGVLVIKQETPIHTIYPRKPR